MIKFKSLNQRRTISKNFKEKRFNTKYFTIYFEKNLNSHKKNDKKFLYISFVMKKSIGNAVIRNK